MLQVKLPYCDSALLTELGQEAEELLQWLASYGAHPDGGVSRFLYSPAWLDAQHGLAKKMNRFGMQTRFDAVGNLFGRIDGKQPGGPTVLTGSHIDTVAYGGRYDGALGIIAGLIATRFLREHYGQPHFNLEVVSFCEEEGSRFPIAYWGSSNVAGLEAYGHPPNVADERGISFEDAMRAMGFGLEAPWNTARSDLAAFVELHIEQGPQLEGEQQAIGIVESIVGQRRYTVQVTGETNHAGTTPMAWRKDALAASADMVQAIGEMARVHGNGLTATVGRLDVHPNIPNVVPGKVQFSVDVRHHREPALAQFCSDVLTRFDMIGATHGVQVESQSWMAHVPVPMSGALTDVAEAVCRAAGVGCQRMASGAGHDAQVLASVCPTALLFVPSRGGISHSALEFTSTQDIAVGIWVLIAMLFRIAYEGVGLS